MTVVLELIGDADYAAVEFEQSEYTVEQIAYYLDTIALSFEDDEKFENIQSELGCEFVLHKFEYVDPAFIKFVRDEVQDYDMVKHSNFYVVDYSE